MTHIHMTRILAAASTAIALSIGAAAFTTAGAQTVVPPAGTTARTVWCAELEPGSMNWE